MMDGATHLDVLKEKISLIYPTESQFIEDLLTVLDNEYLIEDSFYTSVDDKERWSKNTEFFGSYCRANENKYQKQKSLSTIKVSILGLGGVGSNVLLNLAALGVQNFRIVDFDEAIPVIITEEQQPIETQTETITYTRTKKNTGRKPLPQSLSYIEHVYDLSDEEKLILIKKNTKEKFRYLFLINFLSI
ncbi:ThiF family adenylyltransferase [Legionella sp.]|uniref:ThiF family adenylyltransferase n=1 Tax=Legionella sp. TaxID=459 RepID=UPI003D0D521C